MKEDLSKSEESESVLSRAGANASTRTRRPLRNSRTSRISRSDRADKPAGEGSRLIMVVAGLVVVVTGLKLAADFILPILLAFFIATISFPITNWLREHRVPRVFALIITVLVDFAFIAGVVLLGIVLVSELQAKWDSKYYDLTKTRLNQVSEFSNDFYEKFAPKPKSKDASKSPTAPKKPVLTAKEQEAQIAAAARIPGVPDDMLPKQASDLASNEGAPGVEQFKEQLLQTLSTENVLEWVKSIFKQLFSFLGTTFIVMLLTIFMLSEARMFGRRFNAICEARGPNLQRMLSATKDIQRYLGIKTLISMATGLLAGLLCWKMDLEFPLLWGILAFALNFIPAIGSVIAGIPPILLSLLNNGDIGDAMLIGGGYLLINGILGNFLEPTLLGRRFGISTVIVILSVIFWGWLWGPIGMLLAVPLTMLLKVGLDNSSDFRWIGVAISKEAKLKPGADELIIKEAIESQVSLPEDSVGA